MGEEVLGEQGLFCPGPVVGLVIPDPSHLGCRKAGEDDGAGDGAEGRVGVHGRSFGTGPGVVPEQAGAHHLPGCVEQHHTVHVPGDADGLHRTKVVGDVVQHLCAGGDPVGGILLGPARGRAGAVQRSGGNGNHAVALVEQQRLQS